MQYKIPVQIENEDPILLWLSLRQLAIVMVFFAIAYGVFKNLATKVDPVIAALPAIVIAVFWFTIAVFKHSWMTFVPFLLALLRKNINPSERIWMNTVDSFQPIDVGYVSISNEKKEEKVDFNNKIDKMKELDEKLKKI